MDRVRLGLRLLLSFWATFFLRLRFGAARPSWTFVFEVVARSLRWTGVHVGAFPPLEQRRAWKAITQPNALRRKVRVEPVGEIPGWWITPEGARDAVIVFLHGGSYRYGSFESHGELASRLGMAAGARVLFVDYRLAPEHRFPAAVEDVANATRWLLRSVAPSKVVIAGDSAGGALAVSVLLSLRDANEPQLAGAVLLCPWVDLTARGGSLEHNSKWDWALPEHFIDWAQGVADEAQWKDPRLSPTFANLTGLPPMLIQVGSAEMILDQVVAFAQKATAAGVDARLTVEPDMIHDWQLLTAISPIAARSIEAAGAFVREKMPK